MQPFCSLCRVYVLLSKKPVAKTDHRFGTMFGGWIKWGIISRCTCQATTVHLFSVSTSWTFRSVCIYLSIYLSSQSDKPLCRHCRQLPMTTVRCTLVSAGKLSCEGHQHQGHVSGWCSVVIQRIHWGVGYKVSCLIVIPSSGFAIWSSWFLLSLKSFMLLWIRFLLEQFGCPCLLFA